MTLASTSSPAQRLRAEPVGVRTRGPWIPRPGRRSIGIFRFNKIRLWKDLDEHWEIFVTNPVVRHLVDGVQAAVLGPRRPGRHRCAGVRRHDAAEPPAGRRGTDAGDRARYRGPVLRARRSARHWQEPDDHEPARERPCRRKEGALRRGEAGAGSRERTPGGGRAAPVLPGPS